MPKKQYVLRVLPCTPYKTEVFTQWLSEQAEKGRFFRGSFYSLAWFTTAEPTQTEYLLDFSDNLRQSDLTYCGRVFPLCRVYRRTSKEATAQQKKRTGTIIFWLLLSTVCFILFLCQLLRGDPANYPYPEYLLDWWNFMQLPLLGVFLLSALAYVAALCPGWRSRRIAWLNYLRLALTVLLLAFFCFCLISSVTEATEFQETKPIFSAEATSASKLEHTTILGLQTKRYEELSSGDRIIVTQLECCSPSVARWYGDWLNRSIDGQVLSSGELDGVQWTCMEVDVELRGIALYQTECLILVSGCDVVRLTITDDSPYTPQELVQAICTYLSD